MKKNKIFKLILSSNNFPKKIFVIFLLLVNSLFLEANSFKTVIKDEVLNKESVKDLKKNKKILKTILISDIKWEKLKDSVSKSKEIEWKEYNKLKNSESLINKNEKDIFLPNKVNDYLTPPSNELYTNKSFKKIESINSLNRSIVFNNEVVGPDISWLVPPGFVWTKKHKFDSSIRGYNQNLSYKRRADQSWGWNEGDAVGQFYYQFFNNENFSLGTNIGMRSVTNGYSTPIGDGLSAGFRGDYKISSTTGMAIGAEQLLHFDGMTDTGRDIYLTISKAFWKENNYGQFPLKVATAGIGTGRLAEGNVRGLCSDLFGGAGTEVFHQRRLCWAPVFSLSYLLNEKFSTFFEYNSRFFLLGTSISPFREIPLRGTFAITLADHIENYKLNNFGEMTWTFRLSLGY